MGDSGGRAGEGMNRMAALECEDRCLGGRGGLGGGGWSEGEEDELGRVLFLRRGTGAEAPVGAPTGCVCEGRPQTGTEAEN